MIRFEFAILVLSAQRLFAGTCFEVTEMDKTEFGAFVAQNRKNLALTQKELAEKLHVTDKAVSKWERGLSYPDVTLLEPLAEVFGLGVTERVGCRKDY